MSVQEQFAEVSARDRLPAFSEPFALGSAFPASFVPAGTRRSHRLYATLKRMLDLAVAVPALVLAAPLLLAIGLSIRLDSVGPIVFRQTRLGLAGRPFAILKFRTMNVVEDGERVVQASRNDSRITRVGALLRAASLDELPQLLNVIRGEMSLVGPRPHALAHDRMYAALIDQYTQRQRVKPGITGWAQVNGLRGGTPTLDLMRRRVDFDLWYARHASIALDLKILLRTPVEIALRRNAY